MEVVNLVILITLPFAATAAIAGLSAAPWVPTKRHERQFLIDQLTFHDGMTVVDLGCGTGSFLFDVADRYPNVTLIGYDISLLPLVFGWIRKFMHRRAYKNVHLKFGNLFTKNLSSADLVFAFLLEKCYAKLRTPLATLHPNALAIIEAWPLPDVDAARIIEHEGHVPMFIYEGKALRKV